MKFTEFLQEKKDFDLGEKKTLNPKIWSKNHIIPEVKKALLNIAKAFEKFVDVEGLKVIDIVMTGSLANFTWSENSDVDLHLIVDIDDAKDKDNLKNLFMAKKNLWNLQHNITVKGFPVELYIQDKDEPHASSGIYSLKNKKWDKQPKKVHPSINDSYVIRKADEWKKRIDSLIQHKVHDKTTIEAMKKRLKEFRQQGLANDGEYAVENLAFKVLRNDGYVDKLFDYATDAEDDKLTLEGLEDEAV